MDFLWVYILGGIAIVSVLVFMVTFSKDLVLTRKLKLSKTGLMINAGLLVVSLTSIGLVIYLFSSLREQILFFG